MQSSPQDSPFQVGEVHLRSQTNPQGEYHEEIHVGTGWTSSFVFSVDSTDSPPSASLTNPLSAEPKPVIVADPAFAFLIAAGGIVGFKY
jgi:hypothetical protein